MVRILALVAALLLTGAAHATQTAYVDAPGDGLLNLRSGPSTNYRIIEAMPHGSRMTIYRQEGRWAEVRHEGGATGWAHTGYLSPDPVTRHPRDAVGGLPTVYVNAPNDGALNLRDGPGTEHSVVMAMSHGSTAEVLGEQGNWRFVRHASGQIGWAHAGYLSDRVPAPRRTAPVRDRAPVVVSPRRDRPAIIVTPRYDRGPIIVHPGRGRGQGHGKRRGNLCRGYEGALLQLCLAQQLARPYRP